MQTRSTLKEVFPRDLTCRDLKSADFCQQQPWPFLHTSLFCAPSIISQALRAAMVAAELPLRGKLRAEATIFSTDPLILEVLYQCLQTPFVQGLILCWQARIAPCSTHGQKWTRRPRLFCWVRVSDLESGGARCARPPYTHALRALASLRAGEIPLVELAIIVRKEICCRITIKPNYSKIQYVRYTCM